LRRCVAGVAACLLISGCGEVTTSVRAGKAVPPLGIRSLRGAVVLVRSGPYTDRVNAVRLRANVCENSPDAAQTYPESYRIGHYVWYRRKPPVWEQPFRVLVEELHWLVPFGEIQRRCRDLVFEDVIPSDDYGGVESPLGNPFNCYGVRLRIEFKRVTPRRTTMFSTSKRTRIECGAFRRNG
jgi:hypothetical protein